MTDDRRADVERGNPIGAPRAPGREATAADSLEGFRLLPRRRLPVIPPKGERWGGLLRPSTLVWLAVAVVLIAAVLIGLATARSSAPTTLEGVTAEATSQVDAIVSTLPEPPVSIDDDSAVEACADGSGREQYSLERTVVPATGFDATAWVAAVRDHYAADGWNVAVDDPREDGAVGVRLIGLNLVPVQVSAPADGPIMLRTTSRCTAG